MKVFFICSFVLFVSCNNSFKKKEGYVEEKYDNSIPKYIKYYNKEGVLDGQSISFYKKGNIHSYIYFQEGIKLGPIILYYEDGSINTYDNYIDGKKEGVSLHYNEKGFLTMKAYFRNGLKDGNQYFFDYNSGDTIRVENYYKDKLIKIDSIKPFPDGADMSKTQK